MFYLVQEFSEDKKVIVSWIFLKKGHLKGVMMEFDLLWKEKYKT